MGSMRNAPVFNDGVFDLFAIEQREIAKDAKSDVLVDKHMKICYREVSVFDRLRFEFDQGGKEVTLKIQIPQYREIDSHCMLKINGEWHKVFNAAHTFDKQGYPVTELTLIKPEAMYPVLEEL